VSADVTGEQRVTCPRVRGSIDAAERQESAQLDLFLVAAERETREQERIRHAAPGDLTEAELRKGIRELEPPDVYAVAAQVPSVIQARACLEAMVAAERTAERLRVEAEYRIAEWLKGHPLRAVMAARLGKGGGEELAALEAQKAAEFERLQQAKREREAAELRYRRERCKAASAAIEAQRSDRLRIRALREQLEYRELLEHRQPRNGSMRARTARSRYDPGGNRRSQALRFSSDDRQIPKSPAAPRERC